MKTCLITGASGFLGETIRAEMTPHCVVTGIGHEHAPAGMVTMDLREERGWADFLRRTKPDVVIHAAAYRDPDYCEVHPEETRRLNVTPVRVLCDTLPPSAQLVFISTDYVFDGENPPYHEDDPRCPINVYGNSKVEAENLALKRPGSLVVRIPVLVGSTPAKPLYGFIGEMVQALRSKQPQEVDDVLVRCPTWTRDVARALLFLLEREVTGVVHVSGPTAGTRYALTMETARRLGETAGHITSSKTVIPRKARRPRNSALATDKLRALGFTGLTPFPDIIQAVLASAPR